MAKEARLNATQAALDRANSVLSGRTEHVVHAQRAIEAFMQGYGRAFVPPPAPPACGSTLPRAEMTSRQLKTEREGVALALDGSEVLAAATERTGAASAALNGALGLRKISTWSLKPIWYARLNATANVSSRSAGMAAGSAMCQREGGRLCSATEVQQAAKAGFSNCACGYTATQTCSANSFAPFESVTAGDVVFPMAMPTTGCGRPGINFCNFLTEAPGAYCCALMAPDTRKEGRDAMMVAPAKPGSPAAEEQDASEVEKGLADLLSAINAAKGGAPTYDVRRATRASDALRVEPTDGYPLSEPPRPPLPSLHAAVVNATLDTERSIAIAKATKVANAHLAAADAVRDAAITALGLTTAAAQAPSGQLAGALDAAASKLTAKTAEAQAALQRRVNMKPHDSEPHVYNYASALAPGPPTPPAPPRTGKVHRLEKEAAAMAAKAKESSDGDSLTATDSDGDGDSAGGEAAQSVDPSKSQTAKQAAPEFVRPAAVARFKDESAR